MDEAVQRIRESDQAQEAARQRSEIYDVWETDARGNYHQYLVIPDQYGRPERVTPGIQPY